MRKHPDHRQQPIAVWGAPLEAGAGTRGCLMGPASLRTAELIETLETLAPIVIDHGDVTPAPAADFVETPGARALPTVAAWSTALHEAAYAAAKSGATPVFLGGDHSIAFGSISGVARYAQEQDRDVFVIWLDAHADFNTPATSPSGNMHGMPMAYLCGEPGFDAMRGVEPKMQSTAARRPLAPGNIFMLGLRSVDPDERDLLSDRGVRAFDMRDFDERGVASIMRDVLEEISSASSNPWVHVSLDVDFLDPDIAPGVGTTVPGGATFREAHLIMEMLCDSNLVSSLDIVELNPFLDKRGKSARLLVDLVASLFGRRIFDRPSRSY